MIPYPFARFKIGESTYCGGSTEMYQPAIGDQVLVFIYDPPLNAARTLVYPRSPELFFQSGAGRLVVPGAAEDRQEYRDRRQSRTVGKASASRVMKTTCYLIAAVMSLSAIHAAADDCSQPNGNGISSGDVLDITGASSAEINTAIGYWSGGCPGYGGSFPSMSAGGTWRYRGQRDPPYRHLDSHLGQLRPDRMFMFQAPGNTVTGAIVEIWDRQGNGVDCVFTDTLAHELGHVLGLADNDTSACVGHIMGGRPPGGTRSVSSADCAVAGQQWSTSTDTSHGGGAGGAGCPPI